MPMVATETTIPSAQDGASPKTASPSPAADTPAPYERRRPEDTTRYQVVQEHLDTFLAQVEQETGTGLPQFVKDEFEAFLECGIFAHGFLRLRCGDCAHEKLVAFSCKDTREHNLTNIAPRFGSDLDGTSEKNSRHSTAMVRVFRLRPVQR